MKAYLATTGTLFGLLAVLHFWRIFAEWNSFQAKTWYLAGIGAIGVVAGALSIWAYRLLIEPSRPDDGTFAKKRGGVEQ
jgi:hypothetical protein